MKVGIELHHGYLKDEYMPVEQVLEKAKADGYEGVYYKSPFYVSKKLDVGALRGAAACAKDLGMFLDFGIGRVNPYNTTESPEIWRLGGGDYKLAMEKQIYAAAEMGAHELIGVTAGWRGEHKGYFVNDRFRTDVTWEEQLQATTRFLQRLAPVLRETGSRINLETHEEITSYEVLRMIEEIGDDVLGVAFDTANVLSRAEDPVAVAKRAAPYIHQMHAKDGILYFSGNGLVRQLKASGQGIVDYKAIFAEIGKVNPNLHVQVEDHKGLMHVDIYVEQWRNVHPDLSMAEVAELVRLAALCEQRMASGEWMKPDEYEAISYWDEMDERLDSSRKHLQQILKDLGLDG
ncbi:sugar phosphate isomerase/epimerase family protein [Cohnella cholangitidis]|uniref:Sugar phosphate isomerase/epimerase n=1 Tax=Cohnella cholangitidis TaxID=2598458 RepID=A0A7G5BZX7_9BACL|nr:sugar phosphate isomerase/epimerase [Cohnella cholangitidis]QMV42511.1 sugar phosphate isomerase/epimerase [Cohnella cholangitidis]